MTMKRMPRAADLRRHGIGSAILGLTAILLVISFSTVSAATKPARGRLLVATENISDPRFQESVILLVQHDATGTIGLIVNKPLSVSVDHVLPLLPEDLPGDQPLFYGGPVSPGTSWVIFSGEKPAGDAMTIMPGIHLGISNKLFGSRDFRPDHNKVRILTGYAGWAPGQLETEFRRGDWVVMPARQADIFDADPDSLWDKLHGSQGVLI